MTPTQKTVTEEEYHECSSDHCVNCGEKFYIMASGWDVSLGYECPHCEFINAHETLRTYRSMVKEQNS